MLISQSLFIDSEYKADCENKIDYFQALVEGKDASNDPNLTTVIFTSVEVNDSSTIRNKTKEISNSCRKIIKEY